MRALRIIALVLVSIVAAWFGLIAAITMPLGYVLGLALSCAGVGLLAMWRPRH